MTLAQRIVNNPAAYVSRTSSLSTARKWAREASNGRIIAATPGQWWVTRSGAVAKALREAGFEVIA